MKNKNSELTEKIANANTELDLSELENVAGGVITYDAFLERYFTKEKHDLYFVEAAFFITRQPSITREELTIKVIHECIFVGAETYLPQVKEKMYEIIDELLDTDYVKYIKANKV